MVQQKFHAQNEAVRAKFIIAKMKHTISKIETKFTNFRRTKLCQ